VISKVSERVDRRSGPPTRRPADREEIISGQRIRVRETRILSAANRPPSAVLEVLPRGLPLSPEAQERWQASDRA
jgi:hypothetical protein